MSDILKEGAAFTGLIYDVRTKRDGGGRIQIDFGMDALAEIQWVQKVAAIKNCSFQIALVPIDQSSIYPNETHESYPVDQNGEIDLSGG